MSYTYRLLCLKLFTLQSTEERGSAGRYDRSIQNRIILYTQFCVVCSRFLIYLRVFVCDRDDLDDAEYTETRNDTLEQLREFGDSLSRMKEGNLSLVDDLNRIQLVSRLSRFIFFDVCSVFKAACTQNICWCRVFRLPVGRF